jgi:diguanylate cyclase (GGDEF)-like protein
MLYFTLDMTDRLPVRVFVTSRHAARLAALFSDARSELLQATAVADADVLVADQSSSEVADLPPSDPARPRSIGLIGLGPLAAADVNLPVDATVREITLACRLLGEVVRLRRKLQRSEVEHDEALIEARTDPLTGLPNRRAWDEQLASLAPPDGPVTDQCLAIIDLDHFKEINDQHGHATGDALLRAVAHALRSGLRDQDKVARLGGDEFGIVLLRLEDPEAKSVLERMRERVAAAGAVGSLPRCTASIGYCVSGQWTDPSPAKLVNAADRALKQAKTTGRNRVVPYRSA